MSILQKLSGIQMFTCLVLFGQGNWQKIQLNPDFYSEGITAADFNNDGNMDIVAGPYLYPGPDFSVKKEYTLPKETPFNTGGDTDNYVHFAYDINQDGWVDILWQKRWDDSLNWFMNPQSETFEDQGRWDKYNGFEVVNNESPWFTDVTGDTLPEGVCFYQGQVGLLLPDWDNPTAGWEFQAVSPDMGYGQADHGLGVGDINGDGRKDILEKNGWWEQPASGFAFTHHPYEFYDRRYQAEGTGGAQMFGYDVDGDGDEDVITSLQAHGWDLAWFENLDGAGGDFEMHIIMGNRDEEDIYGIAFGQMHAVELGDLNQDGLMDIVTGKRKGAHGAEAGFPAILAWFELSRMGNTVHYYPHVIDTAAGIGTQILVTDVNGDGMPDVLTSRRAGAFVFLNQMEPVNVKSTGSHRTPGRGVHSAEFFNVKGQWRSDKSGLWPGVFYLNYE